MTDTPKNESLHDTILDIAGYAVLAHLLETKQWNDKLYETKDPLLKFFGEVVQTFGLKLQDYGLKDMEEVGLAGVASRLTDKLARLKNLIKSEQHEMLVHNENAENLQTPKKQGDVGYDLVTLRSVEVPPHSQVAVDIETGVRVKVPTGTWGLVVNRSSTPRKRGLIVMPGVIDEGYTGPLYACIFNTTDRSIKVEQGERLAQLILIPSVIRPIKCVEEMPETERGQTGFGSTNV